MARPSNREQRRAQIVEALHVLMAEQGYDGASVAAIARQAGLAPGLVHYHFACKEEILLALVERLADRLGARYDRLLSSASTPWDRLDCWIDAHLAQGEGADSAAVACWVAIGAEAVRRPEVQQAYEAAVRDDLDRGERLVADILGPQLEPDDPRRLATALLAAIEGCYRLASGAPNAVPEGFAAPSVRQMARGLLQSQR